MVSASAADESRSAMTQRAVDDLTRLFQPINLRPTFALTKSNEPSSAATRGGGGGAFGGAPGMRRTAPPTAASTFGAPAGGFGSAAPPGSSLFGSAPRYVCRVSERLLLAKKNFLLVTLTLSEAGGSRASIREQPTGDGRRVRRAMRGAPPASHGYRVVMFEKFESCWTKISRVLLMPRCKGLWADKYRPRQRCRSIAVIQRRRSFLLFHNTP